MLGALAFTTAICGELRYRTVSNPESPDTWQMQPAPYPGGVGYLQPAGQGLKQTATVAKTLRVFLWIQLPVLVVRVLMNFRLSQQFNDPAIDRFSTFELYDLSVLVELVFLGLFIGAAISTMVLLKRMLDNGKILAPGVGEHKSHWAITGWIIPLLNFVRPRQVVDQAWVASRAAGERTPPSAAPPLAAYWWGSFVIYLLADRLAPTAPFNNATLQDYANESLGVAISSSILIVSCVLYLRVLGPLQKRHQAALDSPWVNPRQAANNPFQHGAPTTAPPPPPGVTSPDFQGSGSSGFTQPL